MSYLRGSANYVWSTTAVLGKGATGAVYQGVNKQSGEPVAVKTFNHVSQMRPLDVQMREFEVLNKVDHENIVRLLAVEEDTFRFHEKRTNMQLARAAQTGVLERQVENRSKVLVMELCTGGSLLTLLDDPANSYGLEEQDFLCVLRDLSAGMKHLRDNNIIHRDLKPGNIMKYVSEDGRFVYKLADFGAARELQDDQQFMSLYGTEEYLHPDMYERAVLKKSAGKSFRATVDLWSIGVTLYHVATGALPFRPYGGRRNRDTMFCITSKKESGVISGVQNSENGPIEWSRELPRTCLLTPGLRDKVVPLLAGLLECDDTKMWTFERFFDSVTEVLRCRLLHVFFVNEGREIHAYMPSQATLCDLKAEVFQQTGVSPASQILLVQDRGLLEDLIARDAGGGQLPPTSPSTPYLLLDGTSPRIQVQLGAGAQAARFPAFPTPPVNLEHDASLAKNCCSVAHAMQRLLDKLTRCHTGLQKSAFALAFVLEEHAERHLTKLTHAKHTLGLVDQLLKILLTSQSSLCGVAEAVDVKVQPTEMQTLSRSLSGKQLSRAAIFQQLSHLEKEVGTLEVLLLKGRPLRKSWDLVCKEGPQLDGCSETAATYVHKIRDSWQALARDKAARELSFHDKQFHTLEKNKIRQMCQKLLSLLQVRCLQSCHQVAQSLETWLTEALELLSRCKRLDDELNACLDMVNSYADALEKAGEVFESAATNLAADMKTQRSMRSAANSMSPSIEAVSGVPSLKDVTKRKKVPHHIVNGLHQLRAEQSEILQLIEDNHIIMKSFLNASLQQASEGERK